MAVESKRKCGFRKVGGLYLCGVGEGIECHRLPLNIHVCPTCSAGIKYSRGFTWFKPLAFFGKCGNDSQSACHTQVRPCNVCNPPDGRHGLMWIGKKFYSPDEFTAESISLGVSKRIAAIPRDFVLGETIIYLAHLAAGTERGVEQTMVPSSNASGLTMIPGMAVSVIKKVPAIFYVFRPTRIEKIITETESHDEEEMKKLEKQGITAIVVPDNDKDHKGSVHDKELI